MISWLWLIPAVMAGVVIGFFVAAFAIAVLNGGARWDD